MKPLLFTPSLATTPLQNNDVANEHFCKDTKTDLMKTLDMQTLSNPVTDIVDAYYIVRCGYESTKGK